MRSGYLRKACLIFFLGRRIFEKKKLTKSEIILRLRADAIQLRVDTHRRVRATPQQGPRGDGQPYSNRGSEA